MEAKEMFSEWLAHVKTLPGKIFFLIVLLSFSISPSTGSTPRDAFKTELHEKATSRVSNRSHHYYASFPLPELYSRQNYCSVLASTDIRICHQLKIFKKRKSDFKFRIGFHPRIPQVSDSFPDIA